MIDSNLARALGITRQAPESMIAERLCQQGGINKHQSSFNTETASYLRDVAIELGQHLKTNLSGRPLPLDDVASMVAAELIHKLPRGSAPSVLSAIAPNQMVPAGPASDLPKVCRALVNRHLTNFCRSVLATWLLDGVIEEPDE